MLSYKVVFILLLLHYSSHNIIADRIITSGDIARWYLDADLVVIATLIEKDLIVVRTVDTPTMSEYRTDCDVIIEKYLLHIDSIIKGYSYNDTILVETPEHKSAMTTK